MKSALSSECSGMLDAQPTTVYPASPDDPSRNSKFGFWSEHHCIYFLTIVLSTIVAVGMKFDLTCRQRNLSSMTALRVTNNDVVDQSMTSKYLHSKNTGDLLHIKL